MHCIVHMHIYMCVRTGNYTGLGYNALRIVRLPMNNDTYYTSCGWCLDINSAQMIIVGIWFGNGLLLTLYKKP